MSFLSKLFGGSAAEQEVEASAKEMLASFSELCDATRQTLAVAERDKRNYNDNPNPETKTANEESMACADAAKAKLSAFRSSVQDKITRIGKLGMPDLMKRTQSEFNKLLEKYPD